MASFDSQQLPAVHYCRFDWCLSSFSTPSEYIRHAFLEHLRKEPFEKKCFRRRELADIERAEEGIGESMSIPIPGRMIASSHDSIAKEDSTQSACQQVPSSLPTPPVSEAASPPAHIHPILALPQDTGVDPNLLSAPSPTPAQLFSGDDGQFRIKTPSFRDLSSPGGSPFMADNPGTPDFDAMIEDAIHPRKRQGVDLNLADLSSRNPSLDSAASNADCYAVERHLTQSLEDVMDDGELQLSDLIHQERLEDIENSVTEQGVSYTDASASIRMPVILPPQSQPFFTQGSDLYTGEIFQSHVPLSGSPDLAPAPTFQPAEVAHSTSNQSTNQSESSQESENSSTSNSSNISMPPPAQPPRRTTRNQLKSSSQEFQDPINQTPDPFFFPSSGASARKPFYPQSEVAAPERQVNLRKDPSPTRSPQLTPKHRRKAKSRNPRGLSGSFDLMAPQARQKLSSPLNFTSSRAYHLPAPERLNPSQNDERGPQNPQSGWAYQTQDDETLPPIMTQAPYGSQDF